MAKYEKEGDCNKLKINIVGHRKISIVNGIDMKLIQKGSLPEGKIKFNFRMVEIKV